MAHDERRFDPSIQDAVIFAETLGIQRSAIQKSFGEDYIGLSALSQTTAENPVMIHSEAQYFQHLAHILEVAKDPKGTEARVDHTGVIRRTRSAEADVEASPQMLSMMRACKFALAALELIKPEDTKTVHQIWQVTNRILEYSLLLTNKDEINASLISLSDCLGDLTGVSGKDIRNGDFSMMLKRPTLETRSGTGSGASAGAGGHATQRIVRITPVPLALLTSQVEQLRIDLEGSKHAAYPPGLKATLEKRYPKDATTAGAGKFNISAGSHWAPGLSNFYQVQSQTGASDVGAAPKAYGYSVAMPYGRQENPTGFKEAWARTHSITGASAGRRDPEIASITTDNMRQLTGHMIEVDHADDPKVASERFWGAATKPVSDDSAPVPVIHMISLLSSSNLSRQPWMIKDHDGRFDDYEGDAIATINAEHPGLEITKSLHPVNAVRGMVSGTGIERSRVQTASLVSKIANNLRYAAKAHGAKPSMTGNHLLAVTQSGGSFSDIATAYRSKDMPPSVRPEVSFANKGTLNREKVKQFNLATQAVSEIVRLGADKPGDTPNGMRLNFEMHMAALEVVAVRNSGGSVAMRCKSGKDRAGQTFMLAEAMERFFDQVGHLPSYDNPADQAILGQKFAEVFHERIFHENASQSALGSAGIKDDSLIGKKRALGILPGLRRDMCPKFYRDIIGESAFKNARLTAGLNKPKKPSSKTGKKVAARAMQAMHSTPLLTAASSVTRTDPSRESCGSESSIDADEALTLRASRAERVKYILSRPSKQSTSGIPKT